ncbi:MAG: hypothetical protein G01um101448_615 [Parcubacteria group bacterium Gr01-1014_48]|nr:MAG: hypothetical protein Greene041614_457 [Parcubacteria group bacterium Greene0416_14]TSC73726.1 MAG: hypothetical protein G01um101448_615 [Parcubacteria group bacterium Gr01-1014_48]TSD00991.1 MAG: hypothetical protein Greene101415_564 [Parcubacteria group bacterium Greene1014_15]TSD08113.1 MAG: hypothetical protein Greene07144_397 [Parcubacteria group bacterium Greene0714_4]
MLLYQQKFFGIRKQIGSRKGRTMISLTEARARYEARIQRITTIMDELRQLKIDEQLVFEIAPIEAYIDEFIESPEYRHGDAPFFEFTPVLSDEAKKALTHRYQEIGGWPWCKIDDAEERGYRKEIGCRYTTVGLFLQTEEQHLAVMSRHDGEECI